MSKFVIAGNDGTYIAQKGQNYEPVSHISQAKHYDTQIKAINVLRSCINKNLRERYHVAEDLEYGNNFAMSAIKEQEMKNIGAETISDDQIDKWAADIDSFADFINDTVTRKDQLNAALSSVDQQITDIYHYIEFGKFNAYQGWLITNMLRNRLRQPRKIKDELTVLHELMKCQVNQSLISTMNQTIDTIRNQSYTPRVLSQLFK